MVSTMQKADIVKVTNTGSDKRCVAGDTERERTKWVGSRCTERITFTFWRDIRHINIQRLYGTGVYQWKMRGWVGLEPPRWQEQGGGVIGHVQPLLTTNRERTIEPIDRYS